jgi:hypothetical protein
MKVQRKVRKGATISSQPISLDLSPILAMLLETVRARMPC